MDAEYLAHAAKARARQEVLTARKAERRKAKKAMKTANHVQNQLLHRNKKTPEKKSKRKAFRSKHEDFYRSAEWKQLRYEVLKESNGRCVLCGFSAHDGVRLNVDHIKPISKRPDLKLEKSNLQVTCSSCNWGKGGWDSTDWRYVTPDTFHDHMAAE